MASAVAAVSTVSSVKRDALVQSSNSVSFVGRCSKTLPIMSPAMAPSMVSFLPLANETRVRTAVLPVLSHSDRESRPWILAVSFVGVLRGFHPGVIPRLQFVTVDGLGF